VGTGVPIETEGRERSRGATLSSVTDLGGAEGNPLRESNGLDLQRDVAVTF